MGIFYGRPRRPSDHLSLVYLRTSHVRQLFSVPQPYVLWGRLLPSPPFDSHRVSHSSPLIGPPPFPSFLPLNPADYSSVPVPPGFLNSSRPPPCCNFSGVLANPSLDTTPYNKFFQDNRNIVGAASQKMSLGVPHIPHISLNQPVPTSPMI